MVKLLFFLVWMAGISAVAGPGDTFQKSFCKVVFGDSAYMKFVPEGANRTGVEDSVLGKSKPVRLIGSKDPTGLYCLTPVKTKEACPKQMSFKQGKYLDSNCISKVFSLEELCPEEIANVAPKLKESICKGSANH